MAIMQYAPEAPSAPPRNEPKVAAPEYKGSAVDDKVIPHYSLLTFIEGGRWGVTYYSQLLGSDNATASFDPGTNGVFQQYTKINDFELRVTQELQSSQDDTTSQMLMSGVGVVYPFLQPNKGDMFSAITADGQEGIFIVTGSDRKTMFKESVYEIKYQLAFMTNVFPHHKEDLDKKVVKEVFFHKDLLQAGQSPFLIESEHKSVMTIAELEDTLVTNFYAWFYSREYRTFVIPGQEAPSYDSWLTKFMLSIIGVLSHPQTQHTRKLNTDDDYALEQPNIWTAVFKRDPVILSTCVRKAGLMSTRLFSTNPVAEGIRFSGLAQVVYPIDNISNIDKFNNKIWKDTLSVVPLVPGASNERSTYATGMAEFYEPASPDTLPLILPACVNMQYVFSDSFYAKTPSSKLEALVLDFISNRPINASDVHLLAKDHHKWGVLEQFYYIPLLIAITKCIVNKY